MTPEEAKALIEKQFVDGTLSPAEKEELHRYLADHPELAAMYDRYAQLEVALANDLAPAALQERIMARVTATRATTAAPAPVTSLAPRRRRWPLVASGGAFVAAAAAAVLFFVQIENIGPTMPPPPATAMPTYELTLFRGAQRIRSLDGGTKIPDFGSNTRFEIQVAPTARVDGDVEVRGAFLRPDVLVKMPSRWEPSEVGSFILRNLRGADLGLTEGAWDVVVVVARSADLPEWDALSSATSTTAVRVMRTQLHFSAQ